MRGLRLAGWVANGIDPAIEGPDKFAALIAAEIPNWAKAVEIAGVKIEP